MVLFFSSLWVTHLEGMGFDCIVIAPFLPSCCGFVVFGHGVSSLVGSSILLLMVVQQLVAIFGTFTGDERMSFYSAILNQKPVKLLIFEVYLCFVL